MKSFLKNYTEGWLEGDNRKAIKPIECQYDKDEQEVYCVSLTERRDDDPQLTDGSYHEWNTYTDQTEYGNLTIKEIADWEGTIILIELPL